MLGAVDVFEYLLGLGCMLSAARRDQGRVRPTVSGLLLLHLTAAIQLPGETGTEANRRAGNDSNRYLVNDLGNITKNRTGAQEGFS